MIKNIFCDAPTINIRLYFIVRRWRKRDRVKPDSIVCEAMNVPCYLCVLVYCMIRLYFERSIATINDITNEQTIECGWRTLT